MLLGPWLCDHGSVTRLCSHQAQENTDTLVGKLGWFSRLPWCNTPKSNNNTEPNIGEKTWKPAHDLGPPWQRHPSKALIRGKTVRPGLRSLYPGISGVDVTWQQEKGHPIFPPSWYSTWHRDSYTHSPHNRFNKIKPPDFLKRQRIFLLWIWFKIFHCYMYM